MSLLDRLARLVTSESGNQEQGLTLPLAAAILLLEVERADFEQDAAERQSVSTALAGLFDLSAEGLDDLLATAGVEVESLVSLHEVVETVNSRMSADEKVDLLSLMWRVAYADGSIHPNEEHAIRRVADLLHVRHADFIRAKLSVAPEGEPGFS